jgi:hypothetical protein
VADPAGFALLMHAKHVSVVALTIPALASTVLTGAALAWRRRISPASQRWLGAKLAEHRSCNRRQQRPGEP